MIVIRCVHVCVCVYMYVHEYATAHTKTSENNFMILTLYFYMGCGDQIQDMRYTWHALTGWPWSLFYLSVCLFIIYLYIMLIINSEILSKYLSYQKYGTGQNEVAIS